MWEYVLIGLGVIIAAWQIYVLATGRAAFGGYTVPVVLLIVSLGMIYMGYTSIPPAVPSYAPTTGMLGSGRRRYRR